MDRYRLEDSFTVFNALSPNPKTVPAHVWFRLRWHGGGGIVRVGDADVDFAGRFVTGPASIEWSARGAEGSSFHSDPARTGTTLTAFAGHERNGRFFG